MSAKTFDRDYRHGHITRRPTQYPETNARAVDCRRCRRVTIPKGQGVRFIEWSGRSQHPVYLCDPCVTAVTILEANLDA